MNFLYNESKSEKKNTIFTKNPNLKKIFSFFLCISLRGGGGEGLREGARVSEFFFTKNPN